MKGIILAGGSGTRLHPLTKSVSKQILPIYDKPMIYYPLSVLMLARIREILIISTPRDIRCFKELLGNGTELGMNIQYKIQEKPNGLAEAFIIGEDFIADNNVISLEEKPEQPKSKYAVPGLYFYDNTVIKKAKSLKPSKRGELEITDLNKLYLEEKSLKVNLLGRGFAWLDTGSHKNLLQASNFIETIQTRQGNYVACIEEIAYRNGWIDKEQLIKLGNELIKTDYGRYLIEISEEI